MFFKLTYILRKIDLYFIQLKYLDHFLILCLAIGILFFIGKFYDFMTEFWSELIKWKLDWPMNWPIAFKKLTYNRKFILRLFSSPNSLRLKKPLILSKKRVLSNEYSQQGYKDSNLEMTESESVALPFGDSPLCCALNKIYYSTEKKKCKYFF